MSAIKLLVGFFIFYLGSGYSRADLVTRIANLEKTVDKLSDTVKILGNRQAYQMKIERNEPRMEIYIKGEESLNLTVKEGEWMDLTCYSRLRYAKHRFVKDGKTVANLTKEKRNDSDYVTLPLLVSFYEGGSGINYNFVAAKQHAGQWSCIGFSETFGDLFNTDFNITILEGASTQEEIQSGAKAIFIGGPKSTEIMALDHGNVECLDPTVNNNVPSGGATGAFMPGDKLMLCGGQKSIDGTIADNLDCNHFGEEEPVAALATARYGATSLTVGENNDILWVTGGSASIDDPESKLKSTEFIKAGKLSQPSPDLPYPMKGHCIVRLNDSHVMLFDIRDNTRSFLMDLNNMTAGWTDETEIPMNSFCGVFKHGSRPDVTVVALVPISMDRSRISLWFSDTKEWERLYFRVPRSLEGHDIYNVAYDSTGNGDGLYILGYRDEVSISGKLQCANDKCFFDEKITVLPGRNLTQHDFVLMTPKNQQLSQCQLWDLE